MFRYHKKVVAGICIVALMAIVLALGVGSVALARPHGEFAPYYYPPIVVYNFGSSEDYGYRPYYGFNPYPSARYPNPSYFGYYYPNMGRNSPTYYNYNFKYRNYGDPDEYYGFKRGPGLREYPPYPATGYGSTGIEPPLVRVSWAKDGTLNVRWTGGVEPAKSIEIDLTDDQSRVVGHQTVTELPFRTNITVPESAIYIRVTVHYADGGVASSAVPVP
ncbi:MAG: hypothetical protein Q7N50_06245 [Armatimonadota bacterium]|nr:hypothetical protein [Armatimonadota bacterium]